LLAATALRQRLDRYKPALNGNGNLYKIAHPSGGG